MRCLAFLPLTFMADVEGFAWFLAYAATVCAVVMVGRKVAARTRTASSPVSFA